MALQDKALPTIAPIYGDTPEIQAELGFSDTQKPDHYVKTFRRISASIQAPRESKDGTLYHSFEFSKAGIKKMFPESLTEVDTHRYVEILDVKVMLLPCNEAARTNSGLVGVLIPEYGGGRDQADAEPKSYQMTHNRQVMLAKTGGEMTTSGVQAKAPNKYTAIISHDEVLFYLDLHLHGQPTMEIMNAMFLTYHVTLGFSHRIPEPDPTIIDLPNTAILNTDNAVGTITYSKQGVLNVQILSETPTAIFTTDTNGRYLLDNPINYILTIQDQENPDIQDDIKCTVNEGVFVYDPSAKVIVLTDNAVATTSVRVDNPEFVDIKFATNGLFTGKLTYKAVGKYVPILPIQSKSIYKAESRSMPTYLMNHILNEIHDFKIKNSIV